MNDFINYYELLGVKKDATEEEIRLKYKEQIKKWHPDISKSSEAIEVTKKLNEAKSVLLDDEKRKEYDIYLNNISTNGYQNIKEKIYKEQSNYDEKKLYTKWEYFRDYIKYYNDSSVRKVFGIIFVLLESLFISLLQLINIILAYVISFMSGILKYLTDGIFGLLIIFVIISFLLHGISLPNNFSEWLEVISVIILWFIFSVMPEVVINLLVIKIPKLLSSLNIYLFKKSVGYKE